MKLTVWKEENGEMVLVCPGQIHSDGEFQLIIVSKETECSEIKIFENEDGYLSVQLINIDLELSEWRKAVYGTIYGK